MIFRDVPECSGMFHVPAFIDDHLKRQIIRFDVHQIPTRLNRLVLKIISRRRPRATEESSKEIYRHFHFDNIVSPL